MFYYLGKMKGMREIINFERGECREWGEWWTRKPQKKKVEL